MVVMDVPLPTLEEGKRLLQILCQTQGVNIEANLFEQFVKGSLGLTRKKFNDCILEFYIRVSVFKRLISPSKIQEKKKAIHHFSIFRVLGHSFAAI